LRRRLTCKEKLEIEDSTTTQLNSKITLLALSLCSRATEVPRIAGATSVAEEDNAAVRFSLHHEVYLLFEVCVQPRWDCRVTLKINKY
jgi:hypothetical protein